MSSRAKGDFAHVDQQQVVEVVFCCLQVMIDSNDSIPFRAQGAQKIYDDSLRRGIYPDKWLVHEIDTCVLRKRSCQKHPLLLAAREVADLAIGVAGHSDLFKRLLNFDLVSFSGTLE